MKLLCVLLLVSINNVMFAQDSTLVEKTYVRVVKDGASTAPDFIVITVKDLNTGVSKEICTDMISLQASLFSEGNNQFFKNEEQYLLDKSKQRTFSFKSPEALKRLEFDTYALRDESKLDILIKKEHLRDSLKKISRLRKYQSDQFYKYEDKRDDFLDQISDSIKKIRPLTDEESKILHNLHDQYYDEYYTDTIYNRYRKISSQGQGLMAVWNTKIKRYREKYKLIGKEIARLNNKFFKSLYNRYGLSFCHVAFENGIITYIADESGIISFGVVVD